jgi:hypothetical protein
MPTERTIVTVAPGWLRAAVAHATLAPSSHDAQPWRFRVDGDTVELLADRMRRLPVVDPHDRELVIGCGAALLYLRLAIRNAGRLDVLDLLPDPARPDLLARVRVGAAYFPTREEEALFHAMPRRHSYRRPFDARPVGAAMLGALGAAAFVEGAMLDVTHTGAERESLGALVSAGDRRRAHVPAFALVSTDDDTFGVSTVPQLRLGYPAPVDEEENVAARRAVDELSASA